VLNRLKGQGDLCLRLATHLLGFLRKDSFKADSNLE
jgi:hypothetical protein